MSAGYKATVRQDKSTQLVSSRTHVRPLTGKVFYLDLPSNRMTESLESDIKDLGGVRLNPIFSVLFFSKLRRCLQHLEEAFGN